MYRNACLCADRKRKIGTGDSAALYHLTVNVGNRKGGKSALAKMQYIEREGKYAKDSEELEYKESGNMPEWAADDPAEYWAAADEHERANAALYREIEFALPKELNEQERRDTVHRFARQVVGPEGMPYTMALHKGGGENPHAHLMFSERGHDGIERSAETWFKRANTQDPERGGARKIRGLRRDWLENTRLTWENTANRELDRAGRSEQIDCRSLAAQRQSAIARGDERAAERLDSTGLERIEMAVAVKEHNEKTGAVRTLQRVLEKTKAAIERVHERFAERWRQDRAREAQERRERMTPYERMQEEFEQQERQRLSRPREPEPNRGPDHDWGPSR